MKDSWILTSKSRPPVEGYYLAAWRYGKKWVVSELWYNPQSIGTGWWSSRGYFGQMSAGTESVPVVAWMYMPRFRP